ncbi:VOC family protein [Pelagibacterium lacus]|uniref:VOC family protein n=1 Tax=Pelagibacterium lacus TaxID=2282655 RepID=A0A369WA27_9HYPH|nr:VOC family protein [Pelagibacterium lacus]RDE08921.1 VOC family protein [Pelagibacterium lacus]
MNIQGLFAVATVADMARGEDFYTRLLGRGPDDRPMEGLIQWRQSYFGIQLFEDAARAGRSRMTIVVPDMAETRAQLAGRGLTLEPEINGDFGKIAQIYDPDGNQVTLAEPPKGM